MNDEIKAGMTARLRSGGPMVTVADEPSVARGDVLIAWFAGEELRGGTVPIAALVSTDEETRRQKADDERRELMRRAHEALDNISAFIRRGGQPSPAQLAEWGMWAMRIDTIISDLASELYG